MAADFGFDGCMNIKADSVFYRPSFLGNNKKEKQVDSTKQI